MVICRGLSGKGEVRFLAGAIGWAAAELVATLVLPLWVGARGMEFSWKYVQLSLESNINLVHFLALGTLIWLRSRTLSNRNIYPVLMTLLVYAVYRPFIFMFLENVVKITSWWLLLIKAFVAVGVGVLSMKLYNSSTRRENNHVS